MKHLRQSPTDPEFVQNPYPFYEMARKAGDFIFWEDYGIVCATTARAVNLVLKDRRLGRAAPPAKAYQPQPHTETFYALEEHSMLELDPPRHTRLRGLVLRAFTSRRIAELGPEIEQLSLELAQRLPPGSFDLIETYCAKVPVMIIARLLGVPLSMSDQLLKWSHDMVGMYQASRTHADEVAAGIAAVEFSDFLRGYIRDRRNQPHDDLITQLIAAEEDGHKLSTDEMISTCILLLNAGHEATVHTLGNGVKAMLEAKVDPASVTRETVPTLVEEIMRFDPPLHMFNRWVNEPVEFFGQKLEVGTEVSALLASAGRDTDVTPDANVFLPTRRPVHHIAFGGGLHFCVGAPLARLEMQIALRVLFETHPGIRLDGSAKYADVYHFHGLKDLPVTTG